MKKIICLAIAALGSFIMTASAQQMEPLPLDPQVRYGKLDNGLTYYIRHNELPKGQAEFYIAQKVGSMQEEENQRGLAHFLEHMAFNGTRNFPGDSMLKYLESIGVKFGTNINAYTAFDQTVYNVSNVPLLREGILDSCLLVLHDWASQISLDNEEIDKERGVIHEEWRTRNDATMRMYNALVPVIYEGSKYADRMPIGLMEVVDNFPHQVIKDYYHKWYRPDLQGIVIVGDVDVDKVEAKVKDLFGKIPAAVNPAERIYFPVNDNKEPVVAVGKDKEMSLTNIMVFYKHNTLPKEVKATAAGIVMDYMGSIVSDMLNNRMNELTQKPNPPFLNAYAYDDQFFVAATKDAFTVACMAGANDSKKAMETIFTEVERVNKHGFTASEFERAKADYMKLLETTYNEREKRNNKVYVSEYVDNFLLGDPIPGIEAEYALMGQIVPAIPLEQINQFAKQLITEENIAIGLMSPDKDGVEDVTKEDVLAIYNKAKNTEVEAYVDNVSTDPLISEMPKAGKIVKETPLDAFGAAEWTLSNGAKVVVKPTKLKDDEIVFKGNSKGGNSLLSDADLDNFRHFTEVVSVGGVGKFSAIDLPKMLAGKNVLVRINLSDISENISGSSAVKDLETMMQLLYLTMTDVRKDEEAFQSWKTRMGALYGNLEANPMYVFSDSLTSAIYTSPRQRIPHKDDFDKINYGRVLEIQKERFGDASDFVFTFVGNIDEATFKPLVEQYIASLPANNSKESAKDLGIRIRSGKHQNFFERPMESPKTSIAAVFSGKIKPDLQNRLSFNILVQALRSAYLKTMREDEGGTYSPQIQSDLDQFTHEAWIMAMVDTNDKLRDRMFEIAVAELEKIAKDGPSAEEMTKTTEYLIKTNAQNAQENRYWLNNIDQYYIYGVNDVKGYDEAVKAQTPQMVANIAKELLKNGNIIKVSMDGVAK